MNSWKDLRDVIWEADDLFYRQGVAARVLGLAVVTVFIAAMLTYLWLRYGWPVWAALVVVALASW